MDRLEEARRIPVDTQIGRFVFVLPYKKGRLAIAGFARQLVLNQNVSPEVQAEANALAWCQMTAETVPDGFNWDTFEDDDILVELYSAIIKGEQTFQERFRQPSTPVGS